LDEQKHRNDYNVRLIKKPQINKHFLLKQEKEKGSERGSGREMMHQGLND
jgi:hypothetical protein